MTTEINQYIVKSQATGLQPPIDTISEVKSPVNISPYLWETNLNILYFVKFNSFFDKRLKQS